MNKINIPKDVFEKLYDIPNNYQQGGKISNAQTLTEQYIVDEGSGNTNVEGGEFIKKAQTGNVQQVIGASHVKNGKENIGVNVTLENGDKVLSDYTKIPAKTIKELKDRYNITLKKDSTFAEAQKSFDKKIGIQKITDELSDYIEKLGKNEGIKDEATKKLNETVLLKQISDKKAKLNTLKEPQSMVFDDLFNKQEQIPKRGNPGELLDKNGKVVEESSDNPAQQGGKYKKDEYYQEGGNIEALAQKYNITPERAHELLSMQQGGVQTQQEEQVEGQQSNPQEEQGEINPQEIMSQVAQALQQGADPQEILQQLIQSGVDEQSATQILQQVIQQLQGGQEQPQEQVAQQGIEYMEQGGEKKIDSTNIDNFTQDPSSIGGLPYTPRDTASNDIWKGNNYENKWIPMVNEAMSDPEKAKKIEEWLLSSKSQFSPNIKNQIEGLKGEERKNKITQLATDKFPGLFHNAFLEALKVTTPTETTTDTGATTNVESNNTTQAPDKVTNVLPWTPQRQIYNPTLDPLAIASWNGTRLNQNAQSTEPMLQEQARQTNTNIERIRNSGLPPQQQEALIAQDLAANQIASNDAIFKTGMANQADKARVDTYNAQISDKENLFNEEARQQYQDKAYGALNSYRDSLQNIANQNFIDTNAASENIKKMNYYNAGLDNYAITDNGIQYLNNRATNMALPSIDKMSYKNMTPAQVEALKKAEIDKINKKFSDLKKGLV